MLNSILMVPGPPERLIKLKTDFLKNPKISKYVWIFCKSVWIFPKIFKYVLVSSKIVYHAPVSERGKGLESRKILQPQAAKYH